MKKTKRMTALLLTLGLGVLSIAIGATVNSADVDSPTSITVDGAVPVATPQRIIGNGTGKQWATFFGGEHQAQDLAELDAGTKGRTDWDANAKAACSPWGYIVLSTPTPTDGFGTPKFFWDFPWVTCTIEYSISIWIECDPPAAGAAPTLPGWLPAYPHLKTKHPPRTAATDAEYNKAVAAKYEELKQIKTPEQLIRLVESNRVPGADYSAFERAKREGKITKVILPPLEEFQTTHLERKPENR